jgi:two-component system cell cycle sensor histidine kinase/response regulator CckA
MNHTMTDQGKPSAPTPETLEQTLLSQRALLDNLPHIAWLKDLEGRFLAVNKAFADVCGQPSPDALVGKTDLDVWPADLANAYRADDQAVLQAKKQKVVEERIDGANGVFWVRTYKSPVYAPDGTIVGTTGIAQDVTEQKKAEEARRQSDHKFELVFDLAPDPIAVTGFTGELLYANRAFCNVLGFDRSEIIGRRTVDLGFWQDSGVRARAMDQLRAEGHFDSVEMVLISKDGSRHWMEFSGSLIELDGQQVMVSAARDITESRNAEQSMRASEAAAVQSREQLLSVSEMAHIGHFTVDYHTREMVWTAELFRIAGFAPGSIIPTLELARSCTHPDDREAVEQATLGAIHEPRSIRLKYRMVRPSGEIRHCLATFHGQRSPEGNPCVVGLVQDLTEAHRLEEERLKLEQKVMQSQKLESLGVLAGGIAHDFNNLLTSILGNADLARTELSPTNPACDYLADIETVSRRAADLCRQMLAYSGKGRFVVQALSLNEVVREMAYLLGVSISKKAVIKYNFFPELPSVMADATQIRQIVMNLITNASEAIGEVSGVITLSTGLMDCDEAYLRGVVGDFDTIPPGQYVYFEVSDTGCGMDPATLARIFDPFFTTKFTGRGLGLAAVIGIVRGHKGALRVYSEPRRGTTFKVLFPAYHQPAESAEHTATLEAEWKGHGLVLLADDEESIRSMAKRILEKAGFEVLATADGKQALEAFMKHPGKIRLVVLDMTMPHMDGEACFRELRRLDPEVKVIMTSGYNEQDVISRFVGKGLAGFVQKPYKIGDLLPKIREILTD